MKVNVSEQFWIYLSYMSEVILYKYSKENFQVKGFVHILQKCPTYKLHKVEVIKEPWKCENNIC